MSIKKTIRSISLIEVIIAIYVFGIGILVILKMILSNVTWLYDIRTKDTAVWLAKEAIDIVYHLRDSNVQKWMTWHCAVIAATAEHPCEKYLLWSPAWSRWRVNRSLTGLYTIDERISTWDAQLWYHEWTIATVWGSQYSWFWYNHDSNNGVATLYYRWIDITPVDAYSSYTGYVLKVRSTVQYRRWGTDKQVVLESILWDIR